MGKRIRILGLFLMLLFGVLFVQLNRIQVVDAKKLASAPGNSRNLTNAFSSPRGAILTADGAVVADSIPSADVYHYQRNYPNGKLYADVSGYDSILYGLDGVEAYYNQYLQSHTLTATSLSSLISPKVGADNVVLTISSKLQTVAMNALGSLRGAVVVIDPSTGAILAMVSNPSYDPNLLASHSGTVETNAWNAYLKDPAQPLLARPYRRSYPPGSTFKVVTSSAVYDHDPALATKSYPVESQLALPDTTNVLANYAHENCGGTIPVLLAVSCDTGFAAIGLDLGAVNLSQEASAFGFNQVPPIDLYGAAPSQFPAAATFATRLPALAYSAIGQYNVQATPLEMALVVAGIANKGVIMAPHVMAEITDPQQNVIERYSDHTWLVATSPSTAASVTSLMEGVVRNGTAQGIALPGIAIAAKTGTAQLNLTAANQSSPIGNDNWMVAFAPALNPTIAVAVVVPAQPGINQSSTGAQYAGPIVKAILSAALGVGSGG